MISFLFFFTKNPKPKHFLDKKPEKLRILAIDGGGIKGYFTAYAIKKLKEEYNINLYDYFDMFVGTSTGALLAASIAKKVNVDKIFQMYDDNTLGIFAEKNTIAEQLKKPFMPTYKSKNLRKIIIDEIGEESISKFEKEVKKIFIFTSMNFTEGKPVTYGSSHFQYINKKYNDISMVDVLLSSTAAPFYFEPVRDEYTHDYLSDGGSWANNPSLAAIVLAVGDLNYNINNISILSFGQTATDEIRFEVKKGLTLIKDFKNNEINAMLKATLLATQNFQTFSSILLLKDKYFRYSPENFSVGSSLDHINDVFKNNAKVYWDSNKEKLVKFILEGKDSNYLNGLEKRYN